MASYHAIINGGSGSPSDEWIVLHEGFKHTARFGGIGTLSCLVVSEGATYRPAIGDEIVITEDGLPVFGGHIVSASESGFGGAAVEAIQTAIVANDFNALAQRRYLINVTIPAGTLKAAATVIATLLSGYWVTLSPSQADGPTLPELIFTITRASEALAEIARASNGWNYQIDYNKELRYTSTDPNGSPTDALTAPWDLIEGDGSECGDLIIEPTLTDQYANRVSVVAPTVTDQIDAFVGDGVVDTFLLTGPIYGPVPYAIDTTVGYAVVDYAGSESLGGVNAVALLWEYDPAALTIRRRSAPPPNGTAFQIRYQTQFQPVITVNDTAAQTARGIWEHVEPISTVTGTAGLTAIAQAILRERVADHTSANYPTRRAGLAPGQLQQITSAKRNTNDLFLITDVVSTFDSENLVHEITGLHGGASGGSWEQTVADWSRGTDTPMASPAQATPGSLAGTPAGADGDVQFNNAAVFGADTTRFTYDDSAHELTLDKLTSRAATALAIRSGDGGATHAGALTITGGGVTASGAAAGNVTIAGGTPTNGSSTIAGSVTIKSGDALNQSGGVTITTGAVPASSAALPTGITIKPSTPASSVDPTSVTGAAVVVSGGPGQPNSGTGLGNGTGGDGGALTVSGGVGGAETVAGNTRVGGNGGQLSLTGGTGGNAPGAGGVTNTGGNGGDVVLTPGAGGTGSTANGIAGGVKIPASYLQLTEMTAPVAGATNSVRLYAEDSGGKTRLMALFPTGAAVQIAIEP